MVELYPKVLDATILSDEAQKLHDGMFKRLIGQPRAVKQIVRSYEQIRAGLSKPSKPAGVFLFLGPTGVGKTLAVQLLAESLAGKKEAVIRIDCAEYQHSHEISKIVGSPPGYLGHRETRPLITQERLEQYWTDKCKISFLLFDEIEKASDALWQLLLGITDNAALSLGDNQKVDLSHTLIFMTSNLGVREASKYLHGGTMGFRDMQDLEKSDDALYRIHLRAAKQKFQPEFMNRIDRVIVFRPLEQDSLRAILKLELDDLEYRVWQSPWKDRKDSDPIPEQFKVYLEPTQAALDFLLKEGTSTEYFAREINRTVERFVTFPLGSLIGSRQVLHGDILEIDYVDGAKDLKFSVVGRKDLQPLPPIEPQGGLGAAIANMSPPDAARAKEKEKPVVNEAPLKAVPRTPWRMKSHSRWDAYKEKVHKVEII